MLFVQAHDVVDIAADPTGRTKDGGEAQAGDIGQAAGKKVLLQARRELHLLTDVGKVFVQRFVGLAQQEQFVVQLKKRRCQAILKCLTPQTLRKSGRQDLNLRPLDPQLKACVCNLLCTNGLYLSNKDL